MTRYARAAGSKSSNERVSADPTPWSEMVLPDTTKRLAESIDDDEVTTPKKEKKTPAKKTPKVVKLNDSGLKSPISIKSPSFSTSPAAAPVSAKKAAQKTPTRSKAAGGAKTPSNVETPKAGKLSEPSPLQTRSARKKKAEMNATIGTPNSKSFTPKQSGAGATPKNAKGTSAAKARFTPGAKGKNKKNLDDEDDLKLELDEDKDSDDLDTDDDVEDDSDDEVPEEEVEKMKVLLQGLTSSKSSTRRSILKTPKVDSPKPVKEAQIKKSAQLIENGTPSRGKNKRAALTPKIEAPDVVMEQKDPIETPKISVTTPAKESQEKTPVKANPVKNAMKNSPVPVKQSPAAAKTPVKEANTLKQSPGVPKNQAKASPAPNKTPAKEALNSVNTPAKTPVKTPAVVAKSPAQPKTPASETKVKTPVKRPAEDSTALENSGKKKNNNKLIETPAKENQAPVDQPEIKRPKFAELTEAEKKEKLQAKMLRLKEKKKKRSEARRARRIEQGIQKPPKERSAEEAAEIEAKMTALGKTKRQVTDAPPKPKQISANPEAKFAKTKCLRCRRRGHLLRDCPEGAIPLKCFKCGEASHSSAYCTNVKEDVYAFATCFVCKQTGHVSKSCPQNKNGMFPRGGGCFKCGSNLHLAKNCSEMRKTDEKKPMVKKVVVGMLDAKQSADADVDDISPKKGNFGKGNKNLKKGVVTF